MIGISLILASVLSAGGESPKLVAENVTQIQEMSHAAGFCIGQELALTRIEKNFPSLKPSVFLVRSQFENRFPGSCQELESALSSVAPGAWEKEKSKAQQQVKEFIADPKTAAEAIMVLEEITERTAEGLIPAPMLEPLLYAARPSLADPLWEMRNGWSQSFTSAGHPKSWGLAVRMDVPRSWKAKEGKRPHVLQQWTSRNGTGLEFVNLTIVRAEEELSGVTFEEEFRSDLASGDIQALCKEFMGSMTTRTKRLRGRKVVVENLPAMICSGEVKQQRVDIEMTMSTEILVVVYRDWMVTITTMVAHRPGLSSEAADKRAGTLMNAVGNTLVILSKY